MTVAYWECAKCKDTYTFNVAATASDGELLCRSCYVITEGLKTHKTKKETKDATREEESGPPRH